MTNKKNEIKDIKIKIVDIVIFIIIATLVITTLVNVDKFFFTRPEYDRYVDIPYAKTYSYDENCDYSAEPQATIIKECNEDKGQIIYNKNCEVECDFQSKIYQAELKSYNRKVSWFRMILSLVVSVLVLYVPFKKKEKLIYYAIITGSLITLVFTTVFSYDYIDTSLFSLITLVEVIVVWLIYKKIIKNQ